MKLSYITLIYYEFENFITDDLHTYEENFYIFLRF